ncbi:DUF1289 domain-containing protein [Vibrio nigripulchritudo]|uniref:DUF1289 domain-containing protein n=1 Tax=Vibrio nigripulchritudo TaxID=28173 RepID=UPI0005F9F771|nr:DUF1289 domain-containing protein [Vibrio nigripulchritudo]KJY81070.1 Fe-S protein [Vibrio nigripulchritudo]BCL69224.1 DUF1289 domain-containing protein [Vibrio nigripulchritudo]BDU30558.1 DUF1289 domain-containing protein [Vibrio nigripulchritudo]
MEQLEFFSVPSPCVRVCTTDERGYCNGCMRNRQERFEWLTMTPAQQLHVIKLCRQRYRRKMLKQRKEELQSEAEENSPQQDLF